VGSSVGHGGLSSGGACRFIGSRVFSNLLGSGLLR